MFQNPVTRVPKGTPVLYYGFGGIDPRPGKCVAEHGDDVIDIELDMPWKPQAERLRTKVPRTYPGCERGYLPLWPR